MKKAILAVAFLSLVSNLAYGQLNLGSANSYKPPFNNNGQGPIVFTENRGQWGANTFYRAEAPGVVLYLCGDEIAYKFMHKTELPSELAISDSAISPDKFNRRQYAIDMILVRARFIDANPNPEIIPENRLDYNNNYFYGSDPDQWRTDVPNYTAVTYKDIWPGIDLRYHGTNQSLKYDFIVNPGASLTQIRIRYDGVEDLGISQNGELQARTRFGLVYENIPSVYQVIGNNRREISGRYIIIEPGVFGFAIDGLHDQSLSLVIDPELMYSTYLGGNNIEDGCALAVDNAGNAYITGFTQSANFPTINPYDGSWNGGKDIYISKLASSGRSLAYCTYYGGNGDDVSYGLAIDSSGAVYITGYTGSTNFPTYNAYDNTYNTEWDAFVAKLSAEGNAVVYSTYIGANYSDYAYAIAVDKFGCAYIAGLTGSGSFPIVNAVQPTYRGLWEGFVTKFAATGNMLSYSTFLGGTGNEAVHGIAVDNAGCAYMTGSTNSVNFPTMNPYDSANNGDYDCFVTKLSSSGQTFIYSTYLGGTNRDAAWGIALNRSSNAYIIGYTCSNNFPTLHAYDNSFNGDSDIVVTEFTFAGNELVYSTYIGGDGGDAGYGIAADGPGNAYITGKTESTDFPRINPYDGNFRGVYDAIAAKLSLTGNALSYCTYLGGAGSDGGWAIAVNAIGNAYVMGGTESADFPHVNAYDTSYNSAQDVFVAKFSYGQACNYVPGDINGDGQCIGTDVIYAVRYFKMNGLPPIDSCYLDSTLNYIYTAGDCNADCRFTGSDIMRLVAYFKGIAQIEPCRFFPPE